MTACPAEQERQHETSPGVVADDEVVCRGAYEPNHTNAQGAKSAMIKVADLARGELSVWRLKRDPSFDEHAVVRQIEIGPPNGKLFQILAAAVGAIRAAKIVSENIPQGQRIFCVIDDCRTDVSGGAHPEHATVTLEPIPGVDLSATNAPETLAAKEALFALLRVNVVWSAQPYAIQLLGR